MKKCKVAIIGISGFGSKHLDVVSKLEQEERLELIAVSEINLEANKQVIDILKEKNHEY